MMSIADILARTYTDRCDIYRYESVVEGGITHHREVLKHSNVLCALSQGSLAQRTDENGVAYTQASSKVFFTPDVDVAEGDILLITRDGSAIVRTYVAGEVFPYAGSHIEVKVSRSEPA